MNSFEHGLPDYSKQNNRVKFRGEFYVDTYFRIPSTTSHLLWLIPFLLRLRHRTHRSRPPHLQELELLRPRPAVPRRKEKKRSASVFLPVCFAKFPARCPRLRPPRQAPPR